MSEAEANLEVSSAVAGEWRRVVEEDAADCVKSGEEGEEGEALFFKEEEEDEDEADAFEAAAIILSLTL